MRLHWPFALVASLALALVLTNLGSDYLWEDEGDTAVLGLSILKSGVPKAWDGVTFTDSDRGLRLNDDLVMVSHPWVQYYLAAGSFLVFGENAFAARLPFALAGWATILLAYIFVWRVTANRWAAFCAAALTVSSVQFLLYSRQCRNYSINMLFSCWLIWVFLRMKSWKGCMLFALAAIVLFHTHPLGIVSVGVLGILTLIYPPFAPQRRWFWFALPLILVLTLPWLLLAKAGYTQQTLLVRSVPHFFLRMVQYVIECASVAPLIGIIILLATWLIYRAYAAREAIPQDRRLTFAKSEADFFVVTFATLFFYGLAMAMTQTSGTLRGLGLRYTPAVIPLMAMTAGILIVKISRARPAIWIPLLLIFSFTKLGQLTSWASWSHGFARASESVAVCVPTKAVDCFLNTEQLLFMNDLWRENPGSVAQACKFLQTYARPGDVLITNYEWEPLYFHTRLPQALKIFPDYPVYEAARRKGLPDYVFGVDHPRWVVWRVYWEVYWNAYQGYRWSDVRRQILAQGGRLKQVAEFDETIWENRENIPFRRFADGIYLYPWTDKLPPVAIFRVDWPDDPGDGSQNGPAGTVN
jgi:hypothetical protein